jgi:hypothetical protein
VEKRGDEVLAYFAAEAVALQPDRSVVIAMSPKMALGLAQHLAACSLEIVLDKAEGGPAEEESPDAEDDPLLRLEANVRERRRGKGSDVRPTEGGKW